MIAKKLYKISVIRNGKLDESKAKFYLKDSKEEAIVEYSKDINQKVKVGTEIIHTAEDFLGIQD